MSAKAVAVPSKRSVSSKFEYDWYIRLTTEKVSRWLESPRIVAKDNFTLGWRMLAFQRLNRLEDFRLELLHSDRKDLRVLVQCDLDDFRHDGKVTLIKETIVTRTTDLPITRATVATGVTNYDTVKLTMSIEVVQPIEVLYAPKLSDDFEDLLKSGHFSDVVCKVGGTEIRAHRMILAARSPVFASMFKHRVLESSGCSRVDVIDVEPAVFKEVLRFMYTGKMPMVETNRWVDVLLAAEKYAVEDLKIVCEDQVERNMCVANAANVLRLADLVNSKHLKKRASAFIVRHKGEVMDTPAYRKIAKTHASLLQEIFRWV